MELTSRMKMARFQTFWIQMRKNKPLDESRKIGRTSGTKNGILLCRVLICKKRVKHIVLCSRLCQICRCDPSTRPI
ncbi:hypothetical protein Hanom_Chr11g01003291 [Helianthus anomalus]